MYCNAAHLGATKMIPSTRVPRWHGVQHLALVNSSILLSIALLSHALLKNVISINLFTESLSYEKFYPFRRVCHMYAGSCAGGAAPYHALRN
jgi:hypothetical protein